MTKTTVIHHSADYDGIFCREIAKKFLPDAKLIGWDFGNPPLEIPLGPLYVLDLPLDAPFGFDYRKVGNERGPQHPEGLVWIDHHKSAIDSHPKDIPGYRIDGVAACRLAWQWFTHVPTDGVGPENVPVLPDKEMFIQRRVGEPLAVRLVGEYDIWDHRGDGDLEFQFGLDSTPNIDWDELLQGPDHTADVYRIINSGKASMFCYKKRDADIMRERSFIVDLEGLKFLALNTARCNSNTFASKDIPETGHDALMGFYFNGNKWSVSMYHAAHRKDIDLSLVAVKHGGGGHRGACGFTSDVFPL